MLKCFHILDEKISISFQAVYLGSIYIPEQISWKLSIPTKTKCYTIETNISMI